MKKNNPTAVGVPLINCTDGYGISWYQFESLFSANKKNFIKKEREHVRKGASIIHKQKTSILKKKSYWRKGTLERRNNDFSTRFLIVHNIHVVHPTSWIPIKESMGDQKSGILQQYFILITMRPGFKNLHKYIVVLTI